MPDALPLPLVPADCDLQDFHFMPLEVQRLRSSDLAAVESPACCWYSVLLWCASWHQIPASSLPDDDRVLANFAGFGRNIRGWQRVKASALRGFVLTQAPAGPDGVVPPARWCHPVVAEKALEAWLEKLAQRISGGQGNAKRWETTFDRAPLDEAMATTRALLAALNPQSRALAKSRTGGIAPRSPPDPDPMRSGLPTASRSHPDRIARDKEGTGKGQGGRENAPPAPPPTPRPIDHLGKALRRRGISSAPQAITEWADFLQGACRLKEHGEVDRALDLILEAAKRDGVTIAYSKHAAPFADLVARTLRAERKAANTNTGDQA